MRLFASFALAAALTGCAFASEPFHSPVAGEPSSAPSQITTTVINSPTNPLAGSYPDDLFKPSVMVFIQCHGTTETAYLVNLEYTDADSGKTQNAAMLVSRQIGPAGTTLAMFWVKASTVLAASVTPLERSGATVEASIH